jgi:DNA repair protein RecN (Recombination protein N)
MITYIRVRNLAIVEEVAVEPEPGLNVLTGETGAGKSLLIDSLQFLSGSRASADLVRSGTEKLTAEAVFHVPEELLAELRSGGMEIDEPELIVKREMNAGGRGRVLINGSVVSVRELSAILDRVVEIHGQDESHDRIAGASFREVLDLFAENQPVLVTAKERYRAWQSCASALAELQRSEKDRLLRADLLKYQIDEITKARLEPAEEEPLRSERAILVNARQIGEAATGALDVLSEADQAALPQLARAVAFLHPLLRTIEELRPLHSEIDEIRIRLEEVVRELGRFAGAIRDDPERMEWVEDRLATIERLKKRYGSSVDEVLGHLASISDEYEQLQDYESSLAKLQRAEQESRAAYHDVSEDLSHRRREAAPRLQLAIEQELRDLAMEKTRVSVAVTAGDEGPQGADQVEFLIAPNAGEELRPMNRIASGGELSRIQLAIAAALFKPMQKASQTATLVFDEIDAGIGGRVAEVVGRKLRQLARNNQVICVTHLPQIASFAGTHFRVWKEEAEGRTRARIEKLDVRERRVEEIARMLGGEKITSSAVAHARQLLDDSESSSIRRKRPAASAV